MPLILGAQSAPADTSIVTNSCRFNPADSPTLTYTFGTPTNNKKWTFSAWVKKSELGADNGIMQMGPSGGYTRLNQNGDGQLEFDNSPGGFDGRKMLSAFARDVSAWYHYVAVYDSDNGVAADRMMLYVNGVKQTAFGTDSDPSSGAASGLTSGEDVTVGSNTLGSSEWGGYVAEAALCDGQVYAASDFGEFDSDSPTIWKPKNISGLTFGAQGFYLDFEDSADLGADVSGNGNDFTVANLTATDQMVDTPVNNFCTINPLDGYYQSSTYSEGNCKVVTEGSGTVYAFNTGTMGVSSGKWYWEMKYTAGSAGAGTFLYGVAAELATATSTEVGHTSNAIGLKNANVTHTGDADTAFGGTTYTIGDVMMCALDMTNSRIFFGMNGVWMQPGSATGGDPTDGTGNVALPTAVASTPIGAYLPAFGSYVDAAQTYEVNFGNPSFAITSGNADGNDYGNFEFAPPAGFLALCTKNLGSDGG